MNTIEYKIKSENETLACSVDNAEDNQKPSVICLHGAGPSNRNSTKYLSQALQGKGKSIIRFDYSGQGDSTGEMSKSSLKKRFVETMSVLEYFGLKDNLTIIGTSMGGYIASSLTKNISIRNLILFCPAAYSIHAWNLEFGSGFTQIIREKDSFLHSDIVNILKNFTGRALFIIGSNDEIIPKQVVVLYREALSKCEKFKTHIIDDCPHPIHRWLVNRPDEKKEIEEIVLNFIENN